MPGPDGGWPATERRGDIGDLASTGAATAVTLFHPGQNQAVLVVAAADLAAVEAPLRPQPGSAPGPIDVLTSPGRRPVRVRAVDRDPGEPVDPAPATSVTGTKTGPALQAGR